MQFILSIRLAIYDAIETILSPYNFKSLFRDRFRKALKSFEVDQHY